MFQAATLSKRSFIEEAVKSLLRELVGVLLKARTPLQQPAEEAESCAPLHHGTVRLCDRGRPWIHTDDIFCLQSYQRK